LCLDDFARSLCEVRQYAKVGGQSLVDAQPVGAGRNAARLAELAQLTGVHILASTGFHVPQFYTADHWIHTATEDDLAGLFIRELRQGLYVDGQQAWPTARQLDSRAGVVKAAVPRNGLTATTGRLLRATGRAAVAAGAPLLLHTEKGFQAVEAVQLLMAAGLAPDRILVCHVDRQTDDLAMHENLARLGVYLEYDTICSPRYHDDAAEIQLLHHMIKAGYIRQLLLSLDTTAERMRSYGGQIGLDHLITVFLPMMRAKGITAEQCYQMTRSNPAKALVIIP
jgi:phosphotriesterase-related protein